MKLVQRNTQDFWRSDSKPTITLALNGLKHLEIYAEIVTSDYLAHNDTDELSGVATLRGQDEKFQALQKFRRLPLCSVDVILCNVAPSMPNTWYLVPDMPTQVEMQAWERE